MAIIVTEGDHLKLTCAATGNPKPRISWNLKNGHAIPDGAWRSTKIFFKERLFAGLNIGLLFSF